MAISQAASMAIDHLLLGPPGIAQFVPVEELDQATKDLEVEGDAESDDPESDDDHDHDDKLLGYTENASKTFLTSGSACLDFFFQIVPSTGSSRVVELVQKAWNEDALTALKLVFHLRGVRGTGKSDKLHFYDAAKWLYEFHPQTLVANIDKVAPTGYFKDLLELLQRVIEGDAQIQMRMRLKDVHKSRKKPGKKRRTNIPGPFGRRAHDESEDEVVPKRRRPRKTTGYFSRKGAAARAAKEAGTLRPREERVAESLEKGKQAKEAAAALRKAKKLALAHRAVSKYSTDATFRSLYDAVAKLFADALAKDIKALELDQNKARISLAAKWCPSLDSSYDLRTLLCEAIACRLFPKDADIDYVQLSQEQYVYRARDRLRKEVLVPLRKALELPEVYMSARRWSELPYTRVASTAMKLYKEHFAFHDPQRFSAFLDKVASGKVKIAAGALLPHEILKSAVRDTGDEARVAELQWKQMVADMKQKGSLASSLSVCDVSGSMLGEPMEVCIALGMLTAELSDEPWKDHVITFSNEPVIHKLQGRTLADKYNFTARMSWDMNTNFQKVFDRLLDMAKACNVPPERMVKRIFVFSDMEFDEARGAEVHHYSPGPAPAAAAWETDYRVICNKFRDAGYGQPPDMVFWNLRDSKSTPVTKDQAGVALVSGFSKNLLKLFLKNGGDIDPMLVMKEAIAGDIFDDMKVVD